MESSINLEPFKELDNPLLRAKWLSIEKRNPNGSHVLRDIEMNLTFQDILHGNNIVDGLSFTRALTFKFAQVVNFKSPPGYLTELADKKKVNFEFKWEDQDLVLDNSNLDIAQAVTPNDPYLMSLNEKLALQIGSSTGKPIMIMLPALT